MCVLWGTGSIWREEDRSRGGPDGPWGSPQEGWGQGGSLKDGGAGPRVQGDGGHCGWGEGVGDECCGDGLYQVLLQSQLCLGGERKRKRERER